MGPLEVTEYMFAMQRSGLLTPYTRGLIVNRPAGGMSFHGRMFQARMWREYAMTWHGRSTTSGIDQRWCEQIGHWTYIECKRRSRINVYLARRLRRSRIVTTTKLAIDQTIFDR